MFARVVVFEGTPERMARWGGERFREQVLPAMQAQEGFKGATVLLNRSSGKQIAISYWETLEAVAAAGRRRRGC